MHHLRRITTEPLNQIASSRSGNTEATSDELVAGKAAVAIAADGRESGWLIAFIRAVIVGSATVPDGRQLN